MTVAALRFDTTDAPPSRRLGRWQDIVCDVYVGLDCKSDCDDFCGSVEQARFGDVDYTQIHASAQRVFRTPSRIARSSDDYLLLALGREGQGSVAQDGREAIIRPGQFALYDTTRPYELNFKESFHETVVKIPRELLRQRIGHTQGLTATAFSSSDPIQPFAFNFIVGLAELIDRVDRTVADRLTSQALDLIAMAITTSRNAQGDRRSFHRTALVHEIKALVRARLRDRDLNATTIAAAFRISPRYVNKLFEDENESFGRYVLVRRLELCRRDLADPSLLGRQIGEIAYACGFNDLSHFSRAFRERFGLSPRDSRVHQDC